MDMNNELLAYLKEFDPDEYWISDFIRYPKLRDFILEYKENPDKLNLAYRKQQDIGINKKIDFLIAEFLRSESNLDIFTDDFERDLFVYKLTKRLH